MGITFDETQNSFMFDFEHDGQTDVVRLTEDVYHVTAFGKCFYYGYEFSEDTKGSVRTEFIQYLKFQQDLRSNKDLTQFIQRAINDLHKKINLYDYDMVVMPQSSSMVNRYMLHL